MIGFSSLVWAAVVVYLVERLLPLVRPILEAKHPRPSATEQIPPNLLAFANSESEEWAQDQVKSAILEAYDELRDWNAVAVRVGAL